ncbi:SGPP1 (predicted), partial [Pycnogonum litorale]
MINEKIVKFIEFSRDPYLVVRVQNYFGLYRVDNESVENGTANGVLSSKKSFKVEYDHNVNRKIISSSNSDSNVHDDSDPYVRPSFQNHYRTDSNESTGVDSVSSACEDSDSEANGGYKVNNSFWMYLFVFGASLGYEFFYASFFPFWFWNIDSAVGRRVIFVWSTTFYIGQGLKDIIKWDRPASPPVVCMEKLYAQEYGMPSTHAIVGVSVPFSLLIFTMNRYD